MINWFLPWYSKRRNSSIKFQFWYEISPTQNRQDCTNALSGAVRKWGSSDAIQAGTTVLRCHRGRNRFSARWQPVGVSSGAIGQQLGLQPLLLFLRQQTAKKSAHSPKKNWNVCNKRYHLCLWLSPATIMYSSESSNGGGGRAWDSEKVEMRKVPTRSLQNEWIITVCAGGHQQVCLLYSGTTVCDKISHPLSKKALSSGKQRLLCSVLSPPMIELSF